MAYDPKIVRGLLPFLKPYRLQSLVALILMAIATLTAVAGPYSSRPKSGRSLSLPAGRKLIPSGSVNTGNSGRFSTAVLSTTK